MANYSIEIERNNVTLAQFLRYVRQQCEKKGIYMEIDRDEFEKPSRPESYSYTVINGEKRGRTTDYMERGEGFPLRFCPMCGERVKNE